MPSFDVVTFGAATQDLFLQSKRFEEIPNPDAPDGVSACVAFGAKLPVDDIIYATGGGATNAAVTFARFGLKTGCISNVGKDAMGDLVLAQLKHEKINTSTIRRDAQHKTAQSVILLSGTGHRAILVYRGSSAHLAKSVSTFAACSAKWLYLTSAAGEISVLRGLFGQAKKRGMQIAWNPGQREIALGTKRLAPFLKQCSILLLNREEAAELAELPPRHLLPIVEKLRDFPQTALVITDGQKGAYGYAQNKIHFVPAANVKRINTTGAGDAFGSALTAAFIKTGNLVLALQAAALNAGGVISHMGAKAGILKSAPTQAACARIRIRTHPFHV